jgi:hypothetical protein
MAPVIDALYRGATVGQARSTCALYGVDYLIARIYDPAWSDRQGWVWNLSPAVADPEFRVLSCRDSRPVDEIAR